MLKLQFKKGQPKIKYQLPIKIDQIQVKKSNLKLENDHL